MSVAKQFLEELRAGNIDEAIEQIKEGLRQDAYQKIEETRQEILESYGFVLSEKKKKTYEEEEEESSDDELEEENDESKLNEAYEVEVAVGDARKAHDIAKDLFRGEYKNKGSNVYIFKKEDAKADFIAELDKQGIEYSEDE